MTTRRAFILMGIALVSLTARAEERLRLDETTVLGNREQPRVSYVVPWREFPDEGIGVDTLHPEAPPLEAVDREVLRRSLEYRDLLQKEAPGKSP